jgi:hypothetical protein
MKGSKSLDSVPSVVNVGNFVTRFKLHLATTTDQGAAGPSPASGLPLLLTWLESSPISCVRSASSLWNICEGSMANIWARKWCSGVWPFHLYGAKERSSKWKLACIGQVSYRAVRVLDGSSLPPIIALEPDAASIYCQQQCKHVNLLASDKFMV